MGESTTTTTTPLLELRGVHKRFGNSTILDGVDLKLYAGEAVAIIGPSGTGKSTILRIMSGLLEPDRGEVLVDGKPLDAVAGTDSNVNIGMVFQQAALFDSLTVAENVGFYLLEHSRLAKPEILKIVEEKLRQVGLPNICDRYPSQLSGGMRKRVSLARAIITDPTEKESANQHVLLYDEPTAGLDPVASTIIEDLICNLKDEQNACDSYIVVTHQDSTIRRTADRVIMLYGGKVCWQGSVNELDATDSPHIRQFFSGSINGPIQVLDREA
jgi:phospholipid/cholesterol/gamma-HCH transport system ATP-binding protein